MTTDSPPDPRAEVVAPVRAALDALLARGLVSFAAVVVAVVTTALAPTGPVHVAGHVFLPAVLALFVAGRLVAGARRDRGGAAASPPGEPSAWRRAAELDRDATLVALAVATVVPLAWLAGSTSILFHHLVDPATRGAVVALIAPALLLLWAAATVAWVEMCRERLASALLESERRFRAYWSSVGSAS